MKLPKDVNINNRPPNPPSRILYLRPRTALGRLADRFAWWLLRRVDYKDAYTMEVTTGALQPQQMSSDGGSR